MTDVVPNPYPWPGPLPRPTKPTEPTATQAWTNWHYETFDVVWKEMSEIERYKLALNGRPLSDLFIVTQLVTAMIGAGEIDIAVMRTRASLLLAAIKQLSAPPAPTPAPPPPTPAP